MNWIDTKYIGIIGLSLSRFKKIKIDHYNFRCPICGDSGKSESKARGWFYPNTKNDDAMFKCFNCESSVGFGRFLKNQNTNLFQQYKLEKFKSSSKFSPRKKDKEISYDFVAPVFKKALYNDLDRVDCLPKNHDAVKFLKNRMITDDMLSNFYYTKEFKKFSNHFCPKSFENEKHDQPRLLIPLRTEEGGVYGFQGRDLRQNISNKYMTIKIDSKRDKIYGLDKVDTDKDVFVFEGPIDSMFIKNSLSLVGSNITKYFLDNKNTFIIVYDNEPRSIKTIEKINKAIDLGFRVAFFDKSNPYNDVNDMIISGMSKELITHQLINNTSFGLKAKLMMTEWKRI